MVVLCLLPIPYSRLPSHTGSLQSTLYVASASMAASVVSVHTASMVTRLGEGTMLLAGWPVMSTQLWTG